MISMPLDIQKKMKIQAELAYTNERIHQIKANRDLQGFSQYEYDNLLKKQKELLDQLGS